MATKVPSKLCYEETETEAVLLVGMCRYGEDAPKMLNSLPHDLQSNEGKTIVGAWDEGSFGVFVRGKENITKLRELNDVIRNVNVVILMGGRTMPIDNAGLNILIADRLPDDFFSELEKSDEEKAKVYIEFAESGIEEKLDKAGKRYFALVPEHNAKNKQTKYNIICLLNPMEQNLYKWGWFTIEELEQWADNKGTIVMTEKERKQHWSYKG